jgi:signal transduction histidine kinase
MTRFRRVRRLTWASSAAHSRLTIQSEYRNARPEDTPGCNKGHDMAAASSFDPKPFRQVVLNLLSNAIKFTREGGRIEVAAVPKDGSVEVSVSDTGVGIAPEDQDAVFEEVRQVGASEKKAEGTGLGLTLCRKFVELHGGRIGVRSQLGAGSTFVHDPDASRQVSVNTPRSSAYAVRDDKLSIDRPPKLSRRTSHGDDAADFGDPGRDL